MGRFEGLVGVVRGRGDGSGRGVCRCRTGFWWWRRCTTGRISRCGSWLRSSGSPRPGCRIIQRLGPLLALDDPGPRPVADVERLWIVDGTLIPVRDRTVAASGRNYWFSTNVRPSPACPGGGQRRAPTRQSPRRAHLRPHEELERDGLHHAVQAIATMHNLTHPHRLKRHTRNHITLPSPNLLQQPLAGFHILRARPTPSWAKAEG